LPNYYLFLGLHVGWRSLVLGFPDVLPTEWEYVFFLQNFRAGPDFFFPETWSLAIDAACSVLCILVPSCGNPPAPGFVACPGGCSVFGGTQ